ncbi:MAG: hypothetical protein IKP17_05625 [Oscillospiraceae bacterium]|nr:hypothetical protein [Oscillospiraceae bacterium]MBR4692219.1 hypothetical protein [Oscillospiraceae bacterium]
MRIDPGSQALQALLSLGCGLALGFLYDLLGAMLRRAGREKLLPVFYSPYCLLAAVLLFLLGSIAGRGQLRLFMLLGMLLGGLCYLLLLRPVGAPAAAGIAGLAGAGLRVLLTPLRLLRIPLKKTYKIAKKLFISLKRWFTMHFGVLDSAYKSDPAEAGYEAEKIGYRYRYGHGAGDRDGLRGPVPGKNERPHRGGGGRPGRFGSRGPGSDRGQRFPGIRDRAQRRPGHDRAGRQG